MPTRSSKDKEAEEMTITSFLSLDAGEVANSEDPSTTRLAAARVLSSSIRCRTASGLRRVRKLTLHNSDSISSQRPVQVESAASHRQCVTKRPATAIAIATATATPPVPFRPPQIDSLPFEGHDEQEFLVKGVNVGRNEDVCSKWLQVSNNLTPVVGIGSSKSSPHTKRYSSLVRNSWRPSTAGAIVGSVTCPVRPSTAALHDAGPAIPVTSSPAQTKRPRSSTEAEPFNPDDDQKRISRSCVVDPTTYGKVTLRPLTLLSRSASNGGLHLDVDKVKELPSMRLPTPTPAPSPPLSSSSTSIPASEQIIRRNHKRIKSQTVSYSDEISSPYMYCSLSMDISNDLYPIVERHSVSSSIKERVRPDSPTIPLILQDSTNLLKCSQEVMQAVKMQTEEDIVEISVNATQRDTQTSKKTWTKRLRQAFTTKRPSTPLHAC